MDSEAVASVLVRFLLKGQMFEVYIKKEMSFFWLSRTLKRITVECTGRRRYCCWIAEGSKPPDHQVKCHEVRGGKLPLRGPNRVEGPCGSGGGGLGRKRDKLTCSVDRSKIAGGRQELRNLEGCRPHSPRWMCGAPKEEGHQMVGGMAVGACGAIGGAYGVTVGLELQPELFD